jgi:4-hydroxy-2-oxoheptanedioate aldolase
MSDVLSGSAFEKQLREGAPEFGLFLNSHSPAVAERLAHSGYDGTGWSRHPGNLI